MDPCVVRCSKRRVVRALASIALLAALAVACDTRGFATPRCGTIPDGGCPAAASDPSGPCADPTCATTYTCTEGVWRTAGACAARDAAAAEPDAGAGLEAGPPLDAAIDPGVEGTCPGLQEPDCPLSRALACTGGCCGCEDVYRCEGRGWEAWGACVDGALRPLGR